MKKISKKIGLSLFVFFVTFLLGIVGSNTYNFYNSEYEIIFNVNEEFDYQQLEDKEYLLTVVNSASKYSEINIEKMIENNDINIEKIDEGYKITTGYQYYEEFFISKSRTKGTRVKQFYIDAINKLISDGAVVTYKYESVYIIKNQVNNYIVGSIIGTIGLIGAIIYFIFNKEETEFKYDNVDLYRTPFHKNYWKESVKFLDSTKKLVTLAMLFSLMMICKLFSLPSGFSNLGISFTYLFFALICLIYGPISGLTIGLLSDVLGHFLFNKYGYPFYFGYTIQAMLTGFVYGLCLYKTKLSFMRCFISRVIVNILLNAIWGSICWGDMYGYNFEVIKSYTLIMALPKNIIYLVPQTILLYIFIKFISPILYQNKFINKMVYENIKNK